MDLVFINGLILTLYIKEHSKMVLDMVRANGHKTKQNI